MAGVVQASSSFRATCHCTAPVASDSARISDPSIWSSTRTSADPAMIGDVDEPMRLLNGPIGFFQRTAPAAS